MLEPIVREVLEANEKSAADYRRGKKAAIQSLIGQTIKKTGGQANPTVVRELLERFLEE